MRVFWLTLAGVALFGLLAWPLLTRQLVVNSDLGRAHLPERDFYQRCLADGDDYSWSPRLFCGYFLHGEGQGGFDHPLHLALYSTLPLDVAFNLEVFLNYPLLFAGAYLLLRRHAFEVSASLFGALSITFSGFTLPHYPHTNAIAIVAHVPWLLWLIDVLWRSDSRSTQALAQLGIALATASQVLLGYPQYVWFSALAEGLYVLCLLWSDRRWDRLLLFAGAKGLGLLTGSAQLLPSLEALRDSPRMGYSREFRGTFSLHPGQFLQLLAPTLFNESMQLHEYTAYAGALTTVALGWLALRRGQAAGTLARWATIAAIVAVILAVGKYSPLFRIYLKLPIVGVFRCPCRYLVLAHMAAGVFGACVIRDLFRIRSDGDPTPWRRLLPLLALPLASWLIVIVRPNLGGELRPFVAADGVWVGAAVLSAATALFVAAARGLPGAAVLLALLALADLGYYGFRSVWIYQFADLATLKRQEAAPPGPPHGRVQIGDVYGNTLTMLGTPLTSGYVGLSPPRALDYKADAAQRVAGTAWRYDGTTWETMPDRLPRVRMVTQTHRSDAPQKDLASIDPAKVVLLDREVTLRAGDVGVARIVGDRPGRITVETSAPTEQVLVLAESHHRAWNATIDGNPVETMRAYGDFMAIVTPAGEHRVEWRFEPASVLWGRRLSVAGLLLSVAWAGFWMWRRKESRGVTNRLAA